MRVISSTSAAIGRADCGEGHAVWIPHCQATGFVGHGNVVGVTSTSRLPWIALGVVYVLWGSTYLANRFVLPSVPPLLVGGFRFLVGGVLLAVVVLCVAGRAAFRMDARAVRHHRALGPPAARVGQRHGRGRPAGRVVRAGRAADRRRPAVDRAPARADRRPAADGDDRGRGRRRGRAWRCWCSRARPPAACRAPRGGDRGWCCWPSLGWATGTFATTRLPVPPNPFALAAVQMLTGGVVLLVVGHRAGRAPRRHGRLDVGLGRVGVPEHGRDARGVQRVRLRVGEPAGVDGRHLRLRQPGHRRGARRLRGGGAVHGPPAGGRRGGAARRGAGRLGGAAVPETPLPKTSERPWQHPGYDSAAAGRDDRRARGPPGRAGRAGVRRAASVRGRSPGATSPRSSSGCGSCSSIRSTSPSARTTCRCSPASGPTTGRWSTMRRGRTRRAVPGCSSSTGPTRPAWCRWPIGRCCCPGPSGVAGGSTTRRSSSRSPRSSRTCWPR